MKDLKRNRLNISNQKGFLMLPTRISYARRNGLQILADILELCEIPQPKTRILRDTNTNFKLLEEYLVKLQAAGLIVKRRGIYLTTAKGKDFVHSWVGLQDMLRHDRTPETVRTRRKSVNNGQMLFVVK
jgi:predicted transcriptional regulator